MKPTSSKNGPTINIPNSEPSDFELNEEDLEELECSLGRLDNEAKQPPKKKVKRTVIFSSDDDDDFKDNLEEQFLEYENTQNACVLDSDDPDAQLFKSAGDLFGINEVTDKMNSQQIKSSKKDTESSTDNVIVLD